MTVLAVVLSAAITGGLVYAVQNKQSNDLQSQLNDLKTQVAAIPTATATPVALATATPTATPTAAATATPTTAPTATATAATGCDLKLSTLNNGGGTAGTFYQNIVLTNNGTSTCTLTGYPTVSLLNSAGTTVGNATNSTTVTAKSISIAPGKAAYSAVGFPDSGNFSAGVCKAATTISVTPPGQTTALTVATTRSYCPGFSVTALTSTAQ
jgi:hypothetical protein